MGCKFDEILTQLGTGRWNLLYFAAISHAFFLIPPYAFPGPFLSPPLDHTCKEPAPFGHNNTNTPRERVSSFNKTDRDECVVELRTDEGEPEFVKCTAWDYDNSTFTSTITSEFNLVCDQSFERVIFQSINTLGSLVGDPLCGLLQDKYGRRYPPAVAVVLYFVVSLVLSWTPYFPFINILRIIAGILVPIFVFGFFTIAMEVCEPKYRFMVGILVANPFAFGVITWGGLAYLIREWRWLFFVASLPGALFISFIPFLDESPRWLIVKGRFDEAVKVLEKAARWNGVTLPPREELIELMKEILTEESGNEKKAKKDEVVTQIDRLGWIISMFDAISILFRTPEIRKITLVMCLSALTLICIYTGLSIAGMIFDVNTFLYMVLMGIMEIPAYTVTIPVIEKFGRRTSTIVGYCVCAVSVFAIPFVPNDMGWLTITLAMIGKMFVSTVFQIFFASSVELFPTEVRVRGISIALFASRIGLILTPYIIDTLGIIYYWLPSVIFGILSVMAALATTLLPETLNRPLYETVHALEWDRKMKNQRSHSTSKEEELVQLRQPPAADMR
ncbi:organic cation transporter protein-like [Oratosquilla oratoria]|uniref:organic cation transporter protein-like n=1 Tax=Oratosquilla oratoria TaxID=337810 RepID=UPI003F763F28